MIEIKNLSVRFGDFQALDNITLDIPKGSWTTLVGPNGAGKTTFLKTLLGNSPYDGSIKIEGQEVYKNLRNVAFVPQRPEIPAGMDVSEYVMLGRARIDGWGRESRSSRMYVQKVLEETQLMALRHSPVKQLSGGEMQRVLIARALAQEPEMIILDEPTSALDLHHQIATLNQIERLKEYGTTIISTMHDITLGAMYAERLIIMQSGRVLLDGDSNEVIHSPQLQEAFDHGISIFTTDTGRPVIVATKQGR